MPSMDVAENSWIVVMPSSLRADSLVAIRPALRHGLVDRHEELDVRGRLLQPIEHQLQALLALEAGEHAPQLPHDSELVLGHQQLLAAGARGVDVDGRVDALVGEVARSEEHTSELQSLAYLVCRLLLEKKKKK